MSLYSFSEAIKDLDWTSTPDNQSILAVGFAHEVKILAQQRKTYFDNEPNWAVVWSIQIGRSAPSCLERHIEMKPHVQFHAVHN